MENISINSMGIMAHTNCSEYPAIIKENPPRSAAARIPSTLCLKLPDTSLGEESRQPMAILTPISSIPKLENRMIGITIEMVRTTALEKSVLLKNLISSFLYLFNFPRNFNF